LEQLAFELEQLREKLDIVLIHNHDGQHQANGTHWATGQPLLDRLIHAPEGTSSKTTQLILANQFRRLAHEGGPLPGFQDVEFRAFSQNGEDGILLYIFSLLGMGKRRCVEICASDGIQCNTANLIINHGWHGLMFDGDARLVQRGKEFYSRLEDTFCFPPNLVNAWITRENINDLIRDNGFEGPIDLLSLDIDGNDYWIWEAIEIVRPRVVIAEIQCIWGSDCAVTVPYSKDFRTQFVDRFSIYCGASLPAFVKLGRKKGYRLVGVQNLGFNAVFVADEAGADLLPEVDAQSCLDRPFVHWAKSELLPKVQRFDWVRV
jgi:hypothetical protein